MVRSLPPRPTLESLKKQAKGVLHAHQQRDSVGCKSLRLVQRYAGLAEDQLLAAQVGLCDAQYAVALEYGFDSWAALKQHVEAARGISDRPKHDYSTVNLKGNLTTTDSFSIVMQAACRLLGRSIDPEVIAALSGNSFAPAIRTCEPCKSWWHVQAQERSFDLVTRYVGLQVQDLPRIDCSRLPKPPAKEPQRSAWFAEHLRKPVAPHIRKALDEGKIVITDREWEPRHHYNGWYGWGIITQASDDGTILGACLNGRCDNPMTETLHCRALSLANPQMDLQQAHVEMLRRATACIRGDGGPVSLGKTYVYGLVGMDAWIQTMQTVPGFCAECQERSGQGWGGARETAQWVRDGAERVAGYLRKHGNDFPGEARESIAEAAGCYSRIAAMLHPAIDGQDEECYKTFVGNLDLQRKHVGETLLPVRDELTRAAEHMERALDAIGGAGIQPDQEMPDRQHRSVDAAVRIRERSSLATGGRMAGTRAAR